MDLLTKVLKSRVIVFNVLVVLTAVLTLLLNHEVVAQYPEVLAVLVSFSSGVNIVLRFLTATSLFGEVEEIKVPKDEVKPVKSVK
jgi:zinc transporter ZupT